MKKQIIVCFVLVLMSTPAFGEPPESSDKIQELYEKGKKAYETQEYSDALKYLYAFWVVSEQQLREYPELLTGVNERISISENKIKTALSYYSSSRAPQVERKRFEERHRFSGDGSMGSLSTEDFRESEQASPSPRSLPAIGMMEKNITRIGP